jgi:hypothetical protein
MDLRIDAALEDAWVEFRDARRSDDVVCRAQLRIRADDRVHRRPFRFDRETLAAFAGQIRTLQTGRSGQATLHADGAPEYLLVERDGLAWWLGGEVFHHSDADQHLRFRFAVASVAIDDWVAALEAISSSTSPSLMRDDVKLGDQAASVFPQVAQNRAAGSLTAAPQPPQRPGR